MSAMSLTLLPTSFSNAPASAVRSTPRIAFAPMANMAGRRPPRGYGPNHRDAKLRGVQRELLRGAGLADAGIAREHDNAAVPRNRIVERPAQTLELAQAADEDVERRVHGWCHTGSIVHA
jgi:hypothetical protein